MDQPDRFQMAINFMLNRGRKPALRFVPVQESGLAIACLPVSSRTTKLTARGKPLLNIASGLRFSLKENFLFRRCRDANMSCAGINPKRDFLFVATAAIQELDGEGNHPHHLRLDLLQEQACLSWLARHERLTVTIEHVNEQDVYHPFGRLVLFANVG